jgi:crotonobetainyl-CoA:carnitine CoA-transferase CaiB-like acyl-CoA transferase
LARECDVLIENFRPGVAQRLGIGYEEVARSNPGLVYLSISAFGQNGKYRRYKGYEGIVSAKCGQHVIQNGYRGEEPHYDAVFKSGYGAAVLGLIGVLAALRLKEKTGVGQNVEATMVQANFVYSYGAIRFETPELYSRSSVQGRDPRNNGIGFRIAQCADGEWIQFGSAGGRILDNMMRTLGIDEYFTDPRFSGQGVRFASEEDRRYLISRVDNAVKAKPLDEWIRILEEHDVAYGLFMTTQEFMDHRQVVHNGHVIEVDDPVVGRMKQVGSLLKFAGREWRPRGPAPLLGEHTAEVLARIEETDSAPLPAEGGARTNDMPQGALDGVTVVDLSNYAAAPGGPGILRDLGARVIKVEPLEGDLLDAGSLEIFSRVNRGKERISIDLKTPEGKKLLYRIVADADVFVHNFRPGVPERLGLDYESLRKVNPRLVYLYASAFGSSGPDSSRPAFDAVVSAMAGGPMIQAGVGNPPNDRRTSDNSALLGVAAALLLGLRAREITGESQNLETTMLASAAYLFSDDFLRYEGKPPRPLPDKGQYGLGPLYRLYRARDGWLFLAVLTDDEWSAFCQSVGRPGWQDDPRYGSRDGRRAHEAELAASLQSLFMERTAAEWEELLQARDVACAVASGTWPDFLFDGWDGGRGQYTTTYDYPGVGQVLHTGQSVSLLNTPGSVGVYEPLGAHTQAILAELGCSPNEIADLKRRNVVTWKED